MKIRRFFELPGNQRIYVSNKRIGPMAGLNGFRLIQQDARAVRHRPPRPPIWEIARWILVLPVSVTAYTLAIGLLVQGADQLPLHLPGTVAYTSIFSIASLVAVALGGLTAPVHRFRTACVLTALLSAFLGFVIIGQAIYSDWESGVLVTALCQIAATLIVVYTFWRLEHRADRKLR